MTTQTRPKHGDDLGNDEYRNAPRKASRSELVGRLNRLAVALNFAHEELTAATISA